MTTIDLRNGDCIEQMRQLKSNSVDSIVTDPPYELGFMGKSWDSTGIAYSVKMWDEALRVLKPGGHLLAFSGSRTYHRMVVAIEDAGFEIRDQIMWVYGSGFPKSLDVEKAINKTAGVQFKAQPASGVGFMNSTDDGYNTTLNQLVQVGESTDKAKQWAGWGTALKPAHEPIVLARKPLIGTVATNVIIHGTGALNIDGSRVDGRELSQSRGSKTTSAVYSNINVESLTNAYPQELGRWPANFIHDGSDEVVELFPITSPSKAAPRNPNGKISTNAFGDFNGQPGIIGGHNDNGGSAARFFYCAKASKKDRNEGLDDFAGKEVGTKGNGLALTCATCGASTLQGCECPDRTYVNPTRANYHPTVKPTELMRYLVRIVTPPNGTVLDPFMGSGSTGKAAVLERFNFIGIDQSADYLEIATARIKHALELIESQLL
jgi:site-specific DNA-methyltransferase (adenine-specific)